MRCFCQYFMLALTYAVAGFFAWRYGILGEVWQADVTHMTSIIGVVFAATCGYLGFASWRFDRAVEPWGSIPQRDRIANADAGLARASAFLVTLVGLLGTALGLMAQVRAFGSADLSNPANAVALIGQIGTGLSTALYATSCGIVACIGITTMNLNLEYFLDRDEGGGS